MDMRAILWNYSFIIEQMETLQEIAESAGNLDASATLKEATDEMLKRYHSLIANQNAKEVS